MNAKVRIPAEAITLRPFLASDCPEYLSWFRDPELDRQLGPMDEAWLAHVLAARDAVQLAAVGAEELLAVVGVHFATSEFPWLYLTDFAVRPNLRRTGIGRIVLARLLGWPEFAAVAQWRTGVLAGNPAALLYFERAGWRRTGEVDAESGMIELGFGTAP